MASFIRSDLEFILAQIKISEAHAAGTPLAQLLPNGEVAFGLRTVDGSDNHILAAQSEQGAADNPFPRLVDPAFRPAESGTTYQQTSGTVIDSQPRVISNLIVDQTANNPAAVAAAARTDGSGLVDGTRADGTPFQTFFIPNTAPDEGLSAPFNSWMTFFGQFFDHGLDLVNKGGSGTVFIPLRADDPLFVPGSPTNFMVLTRATNQPGADGILGTADDVHEHTNQTSPFVDQNQTYSSHPSHQVFLRQYALNGAGDPVDTGKLITQPGVGGMATWAAVKAQARDLLGINLTDADVNNVPLLATDQYGNFIRGANGLPQIVTATGLVEGNLAAPISTASAIRTGHAFLDDIAHTANPRSSTGALLTPDADNVVGNTPPAGQYDNELLDRHYMAGDGRVNENIGLTTVHHVFHAEHNRQVDEIKAIITATNDAAFIAEWHLPDGSWNGARLFQAAKFATEMQYQHLVFEEFARTIQPQIDAFIDFDDTINPAIVAEFAHTVYRFGHSMLTETIDRLDPNFASSEIGLIQAFLNPLAFAASGPTPEEAAGAIIRGVTRQVGNEIDEFVTEALRNNLLGLPLDLPAINMARARDTGIPSLNAARREFYAGTGDEQLRPYTSWADFAQFLKHPESLVNFIAAYGTHASITGAATSAAKRAAALNLVLSGDPFLQQSAATSGVDNIDFWVGGLAERKMPFGGMLGSTFNFVFETQLERLQDGDRLYYLHRTAGMNFLSELENNSFSKLIMANTDATHLPGVVFLTPGLILEVDQSKQFNADLGNADPAEVIRAPGFLQYTGGEHVVLGGTAGNDTLIAGIGDDTLYGDAGNDRLEGGHGNDEILGGDGDDIITDMGGDDVLKGEAGNDVLHGGQGENLIIAGPGNDFIITGEDFSEVFAGPGNDFILGSRTNIQMLGAEGDDWIEIGAQDGAPGDNFDPFAQDLVVGHDVFVGSGTFDEMIGEGGDDIGVGSEGPDKFKMGSGFDWATFKNERAGVSADFFSDAFNAAPVTPATAATGAMFAQVEGLSGSAHGDILRGDNADAVQIANAGFTGSVLTNPGLIDGLQDLLGVGVTSFGAGNIILGGGGSDLIEGRGGDDIIDGDRWLNVRISVRANPDGTGAEIATVDSVQDLVPQMMSGAINPGQLVIAREILESDTAFDTAVFSDLRAAYTVEGDDLFPDFNGGMDVDGDGFITVTHTLPTVGNLTDGIDRLAGIERLQFNDMTIELAPGANSGPSGQLAILNAINLPDNTPVVGQVLRASIAGVTDADNPGAITGPVSYVWQFEEIAGSGVFRDITLGLAPVATPSALGPTFQVTPNLAGLALRVKAHYVDGAGVLETVFSAPSAPVGPGVLTPPPVVSAAAAQQTADSTGFKLIRSDLQFILDQIRISERHAAGEDLLSLLPNARTSGGLRTVDGSYNNLVAGQSEFGASDNLFPRLVPVQLDGAYNQTNGLVVDPQPRIISNLVVDQTIDNPAAWAAALKPLDPLDAQAAEDAKALKESTAEAAAAAQAAELAATAASNQADAELAAALAALTQAQNDAAAATAASDAADAALAAAQAALAQAQIDAAAATAASDAADADLAIALAALTQAQSDAAAAAAASDAADAALAAALNALTQAQNDAAAATAASDAADAALAAAQAAAAAAQAAEDAALAAVPVAQVAFDAAQAAADAAQIAEDAALAALAVAQADFDAAQAAANAAQAAEDTALAALATAQANFDAAQAAATAAQAAEDAATAALATAQANLDNAQAAATAAQAAEDAALAALATAQTTFDNAQAAAAAAQAAQDAAIASSNAADQAATDASATLDIVNGVTPGDPVVAAQAAADSAAAALAAAQAALDAAIAAGDATAIADATAARDAASTADATAAAALAALTADPTASLPETVAAVEDAATTAADAATAAQSAELSAIAASDAADASLSAAQTALAQAQADAAAATAASDQADADLAAAQAALTQAQADAAAATAASDAADADLAAAQAALTQAQADLAAATAASDAADADLAAAQAALTQAQADAAAATAASDQADAELAIAQAALTQAQADAAAATAASDQADADVVTAQAAADAAQATENAALAALADAQAAFDAAQADAGAAQAAEDAALAALATAQAGFDSAQAAANAAQAAEDAALAALADSQADAANAQTAADAAQAAEDAALAALADAQTNATNAQAAATAAQAAEDTAIAASDQADLDAQAASDAFDTLLTDLGLVTPSGSLVIQNVAPDEGLSAPFNAWMTFFGQFFDHGLDLVNKGGSGTVFIPLQEDDPLYVPGSPTNFMVLTRATNQPGPDGILGTADDVHEHTNQTSPFVDQNQTYTSHPSHQVFLREYVLNAAGDPVATGKLITEPGAGGMATWAAVKAQAAGLLGINLTDADVTNLPLLATDAYGAFLRGPNGLPQIVTAGGLVEGNLASPISTAAALRTGHAFLDDIAHTAAPRNANGTMKAADSDSTVGNPVAPGEYDNELLDAHYIAGDGRVNENIALTTVHHVFHAEHNRLVDHIKAVVLGSSDPAWIAQWQLPGGAWNGERLFQAAKFTTEMQYQHLVFEEFARTIQPQIDIFIGPTQNYDTSINPAIVAEFAHTVYRFGHSMLTETIERLDPAFASSEIGLIEAFLNPLAFVASGPTPEAAAGAITRGITRQPGMEIDEFVVEALRNNLLGLPLDLPTINLARGRDAGVPTLNEARQEFFAMTGDSQLRPYQSWADFALHLKHPESLVNFIAAYGSHASIAAATTLAAKRAAALELVLNGDPFLDESAATSGLNDVDLWIGGLAEAKMPFGGMLGSTFNFVFETQMEKLQDADRFYYLDRTAGLNFLSELENNSFARMVMANTDAKHLPGLIFSSNLILELDQAQQYNPGLGNADPEGEVIRSAGSLQYTGGDHVTLGGTAGNDRLFAGIGDDTVYGDAGNDRIDGGDGNDTLDGGAGDDIITDTGGDDVIKGNDGNDVIHGGQGFNLIIGGHGSDFIITGEDAAETFAGPGNDFVLSLSSAVEQNMGNEGDDWLEFGNLDGNPGDNFNPLGLDDVAGNDVYIGNGMPDIMNGEGGDDVMVGSGGPGDKYLGASGFDWATFKDSPAVSLDMSIRAFDAGPVAVADGVLARFAQVEGLSGSAFSDSLHGDDADAAVIATAGTQGSVLTNIGLISGLQAFLGAGVTSFGSGNILLGGGGSDLIEGRGGDDLIDGDRWLNVRISVRANANGTGAEILSVDRMQDIAPQMLAGTYNPGQLTIAREILTATGFNYDTALFSDLRANYTVATVGGVTTVTHNNPVAVLQDGIDRLTGIERLQFSDQAVTLAAPNPNAPNNGPRGTVSVSDFTPRVGQVLTASLPNVTDADNPGGAITGPVTYYWQAETAPQSGVFRDVVFAFAGGQSRLTGPTITVTPDLLGVALRVRAEYRDAKSIVETVFSAPTAATQAALEAPNQDPVGTVNINDTTPVIGQVLTAASAFTDANGIVAGSATFQWQSGNTAIFSDIAGATGTTYTVTAADSGLMLRVVVTYTDGQGNLEQVISSPTFTVGAVANGTNGDDLLFGTEGDDLLNGLGGNDTIHGLGGNDTLNGDGGNDTLFGYAGDDTLNGGTGNDTLDGGAGNDAMAGGTGDDRYFVNAAGDTVTEGAGAGTDAVMVSLNTYTLGANVENLQFVGAAGNFAGTGNNLNNAMTAGAGNDTLNGLDGNDILNGAAGNDALNGGAGNDTMDGGAGADAMTGGTGDDRYFVDNAGDTTVEGAGAGTDAVMVSLAAYTMAANVENLAYTGAGNFNGTGNASGNIMSGGAGNDTLNGAAGNDTLNGLGGNDTLNGGADNDLLNGGAGSDAMAGGTGDDRYVVDAAGDSVTEAAGAGTDTVETTLASYTLGNNVENLAFTGAGNFAGTGNGLNNAIGGGAGSDNLQGAGGNDTLTGNAGNDTLDGGAGVDTMTGGLGDDRYFVANAGDSVVEAANQGTDAVMVSLNTYTMSANVENLLFNGAGNFTGTGNVLANAMSGGGGNDLLNGGDGNDILNGNGGNDTLNGQAGNDTLNGGAGNDRLTGGAGNDTLDGGIGTDVFVFFPAGFGNDRINGFDADPAGGQDLMDITGLGITAATFAASVQLTGSAAGTTVTIGADTILLTGIPLAQVNVTDFLLA